MATRFYLPSTGDSSSFGIGNLAIDAGWNTISANHIQRPMYNAKQSTALTTISHSFNVPNSAIGRIAMYISPPLAATQNWNSATLSASVRIRETSTAANFAMAYGFEVWDTSANDVIGVSNLTWTDGVEMSTTLGSRYHTSTGSASWFSSDIGDRVLFYIGVFRISGAGSSHTCEVNLGDNAAVDLNAANADTGADNPWFEVSPNLTFLPETGTNTNQLMMMGVGA